MNDTDNTNNNGNNRSQVPDPFWDTVRSDLNTLSRDEFEQLMWGHSHPFGFGPWHENRRGRHRPARHQDAHRSSEGRRNADDEDTRVEDATDTDGTTKDSPQDRGSHFSSLHSHPQQVLSDYYYSHLPPPPHSHDHPHHGPPPPFGPLRGRGGRGGCGRGGRGRGGWGHHHPPPPQFNGPFDFSPILRALSAHPLAQTWRDFAGNHAAQHEGHTEEQQDVVFSPPIDIFSVEKAYVLHVALPNVSRENIDVSWDGNNLHITGVANRPGSEEFLSTLISSEISVGMFERKIKLPPPESSDSEDVDAYGITAKMENGILIVTVPKVEKDWTEVHKIEI
ncbi:HSP20-like chaperone, partial [Xylaria arbuscula]